MSKQMDTYMDTNEDFGQLLEKHGITNPLQESNTEIALVAQLDRASGCGPEGWGFESPRARQNIESLVSIMRERWLSGRKRSPAKRLSAHKGASRVRIPPSPP